MSTGNQGVTRSIRHALIGDLIIQDIQDIQEIQDTLGDSEICERSLRNGGNRRGDYFQAHQMNSTGKSDGRWFSLCQAVKMTNENQWKRTSSWK